MMHHDYPLPPPETLAWIEDARRIGTPEGFIREELARRGMDAEAIAYALAPGATVCAIAESSTEKIPLHPFSRMLLYGAVLGFPAAWFMARENSRALRGQDRIGRWCLIRFLVSYFFVLCTLGFLVWLFGRMTGTSGDLWTFVPFVVLAMHVSATAILWLVARRAQEPFRADAAGRDELAPADLMVPFGFGLLGLFVEAALITLGAFVASRLLA